MPILLSNQGMHFSLKIYFLTNPHKSRTQVEPRRSKRTRTSKSFGPDFLTYLLEDEPQSFKEAMSSPEAPYWKEAIKDEVESILQNHMWELVDLPPCSKPLGYKWIFKKKMKAD